MRLGGRMAPSRPVLCAILASDGARPPPAAQGPERPGPAQHSAALVGRGTLAGRSGRPSIRQASGLAAKAALTTLSPQGPLCRYGKSNRVTAGVLLRPVQCTTSNHPWQYTLQVSGRPVASSTSEAAA